MVASALRLVVARYQRRSHGLEPAWGILRSTSERGDMGPSIYDVHTEGEGLRWTYVDGGEGVQPHVDYASNFCFSKSLFSSIPTSTYTMIPFYQSHTSTDTMIIQHNS